MSVLRQRTPDRRVQFLEQRERLKDVYLQRMRTREAATEERIQEEHPAGTERSGMLHMRRK